MATKKEIIYSLQGKREEILQLGVKRLGIFGSVVRNEQNPNSDIDIIVEFFPGKKSFHNFMQLAFLLEDTFQKKIDLVTPESISKYIYPHIQKEIEYVPLAA